jgi:hypothetical protein
MPFQKYCPTLNTNKAHARTLQKSLNLKLNTAQIIVANMYGCCEWAELKKHCDQKFDSSDFFLPMYYLEQEEIELFWLLVNKYRKELMAVYKSNTQHPQESLLNLIVNEKFRNIEHYQIEQVLNDYGQCGESFYSFKGSIERAENSALRIINKLLSWGRERGPINLWLNTSTYQQSIYAYCKFSGNSDNHVTLRVQEWDTALQIPKTELSVCNKSWYIDFMIGYVQMLARQFINLGYQPTFEFFKIENTHLSTLELAHESSNHPKHGIYKLAQRLLMLGGDLHVNMTYHEITATKGIRLTYSK